MRDRSGRESSRQLGDGTEDKTGDDYTIYIAETNIVCDPSLDLHLLVERLFYIILPQKSAQRKGESC